MNLKQAILQQINYDQAKRLCDELEIVGPDRRRLSAMQKALSRKRRATPGLLLDQLSEVQVKAVCEALKLPTIGRRGKLIADLLATIDGQAAGPPATPPTNHDSPPMGKRRAARAADSLPPGTASGAEGYRHPEATSPLRPDVGTQSQFKKKKPPATYRYDSSLAPAMEWDGQNPAREHGEQALAKLLAATQELAAVEAALAADPPPAADDLKTLRSRVGELRAKMQDASEALQALGKPFLNWTGKAERLSFDVPTLPLFVHERLSTKAIIETLTGHRRIKEKQSTLFDLYGDPEHSVTDQVLKAYEHRDKWTNRMILGDSLAVMNSLLHYESLGGQVQMIYMDPPYGVKFGSNFQPFVRKRDVKHNDDDDFTREPEMVQAYRDTWELGLHSYLTYLRDRLLLARELLTPSGSIFLQISDENVHHVREVMDEVFGADNRVCMITFRTTASLASSTIGTNSDYLLWYARDKSRSKYCRLYLPKTLESDVGGRFTRVELPGGTRRVMTTEERENPASLPAGARIYRHDNLVSQGISPNSSGPYKFEEHLFHPPKNSHWKTDPGGLDQLATARRLAAPTPNSLSYVRFLDDFPVSEVANVWTDTQTGAFTDAKVFVVQTNVKVVQRCILMTTDPGDLVLDPTCGSGTTAYVAEQWGRRWITTDVSRVPLALARQRLLTATFPWYELKEPARGPAGGFVYQRKQNRKGEEIGGIVPHITLKSIANNEPPQEEVLVDRPETESGITRVTGPFCVEATIPTPVDLDGDGQADGSASIAVEHGSYVERMLEILRKSPVLRLEGNKTVTLRNIRPPAKSLSLSAEALVAPSAEGQKPRLDALVEDAVEDNKNLLKFSGQPVAFVFGPENGAISNRLVESAAREAHAKSYTHLYVIGFAIDAKARETIEQADAVFGIPATYVQATPDLLMGDLLKNMRSSQIFSVCGLPEVKVHKAGSGKFQVELLGLDTFDPITMESNSRGANDVPCWLLDTDYNGLCFHVSQAFFPRTGAWDNLKRSLRGQFDDSVWDHLAGTTSAPFEAGEHGQVAVKVIDDRGNELVVVKQLDLRAR